MARSRSPQSLGDVLSTVVKQLGIERQLDEARVVEAWAMLAGPQINRVTRSAWVKGERLFVKIESAAWRQELHMNRTAWRDRVNAQLGAPLVKEIVFR